MTPLESLETRFAQIREQIARAALGREVTLIAVSKKQPIEAIEALYRLGQRDFGENYAQELLDKAAHLAARGCAGIRWHFIGHLQSNKAKSLIGTVHAIHSLDSEKLARALAQKVEAAGSAPLPVFIEVNIDREESKGGVAPESVEALARSLTALPALQLQGLMCIPQAHGGIAGARDAFARLRQLEQSVCRPLGSAGKLSMGMSEDFETATHEGATHVRVGTLLFGPRISHENPAGKGTEAP